METVYLTRLARSLHIVEGPTPIFCNQGPSNEESAYKVWCDYKKHAKVFDYTHMPAMLWSDSQNAIANAHTPFGWLTNKLRHIKTAFHFVKQYVLPNDQDCNLTLEATDRDAYGLGHVRGEDNPSDILTKGFGDKNTKKNAKAEVFTRHARFCLGMRH